MTNAKTIAEAVALYRRMNQSSRVLGQFRYTANGGQKRERGCIFCGYSTGSWSGAWPRTQQTIQRELDHRASDCAARFLAAHATSATQKAA